MRINYFTENTWPMVFNYFKNFSLEKCSLTLPYMVIFTEFMNRQVIHMLMVQLEGPGNSNTIDLVNLNVH